MAAPDRVDYDERGDLDDIVINDVSMLRMELKMTPKLIKKIQISSPLRLADLQPGDKVQGFEHWGCIPENATRTVHGDEKGLFLHCREGRHYIDGQVGDDGEHLVGMCRA